MLNKVFSAKIVIIGINITINIANVIINNAVVVFIYTQLLGGGCSRFRT